MKIFSDLLYLQGCLVVFCKAIINELTQKMDLNGSKLF